jgi:hypothetical protein
VGGAHVEHRGRFFGDCEIVAHPKDSLRNAVAALSSRQGRPPLRLAQPEATGLLQLGGLRVRGVNGSLVRIAVDCGSGGTAGLPEGRSADRCGHGGSVSVRGVGSGSGGVVKV